MNMHLVNISFQQRSCERGTHTADCIVNTVSLKLFKIDSDRIAINYSVFIRLFSVANDLKINEIHRRLIIISNWISIFIIF